MARIDTLALAHYFEVALGGAAPQLVAGLAETDRNRHRTAVTMLAHHLAEYMSRLEIVSIDAPCAPDPLPIFPEFESDPR
nr:hypothetical protein [Sphingomonas laterariae]